MITQLNLSSFLERHAISAYRVVKETSGQLAPNTVYDLARKPARRIDLRTVGEVVNALERITGSPVTINDLLERVPEPEADENVPLEPVDLTDLIAAAVKDAKSSKPQGKPLGSRHPVTVRGHGPTIVELIREGRR